MHKETVTPMSTMLILHESGTPFTGILKNQILLYKPHLQALRTQAYKVSLSPNHIMPWKLEMKLSTWKNYSLQHTSISQRGKRILKINPKTTTSINRPSCSMLKTKKDHSQHLHARHHPANYIVGLQSLHSHIPM